MQFNYPQVKYEQFMTKSGNSKSFWLSAAGKESVQADLTMEWYKMVRIYGRLIDYAQYPVQGALIKLQKVLPSSWREEGIVVQKACSDCNGFYQFELMYEPDVAYKIIASYELGNGGEQIIQYGVPSCIEEQQVIGILDVPQMQWISRSEPDIYTYRVREDG